jgi:osmotically-inducible protein OsmY
MAQDRWNDHRYGDEPLWDQSRRRERERRSMTGPQDDRYSDDRARRADDDDDTRYRPFGDTGPISTRSGAYSGDGRPYGSSGRYDDLSPAYRDFQMNQRRIHRGDYAADRYTPNPREGRGEEPRSWWDRTQDELSSWFGDENARRRREWDEHQSDVRAEHRGRGPKGYKRTDARIEEDLNDRLTEDSYLDASDIQVSVDGGEVTLSGLVARREDKRRAEDLAERVTGVSHVQNNLRVRPRGDATASDITL